MLGTSSTRQPTSPARPAPTRWPTSSCPTTKATTSASGTSGATARRARVAAPLRLNLLQSARDAVASRPKRLRGRRARLVLIGQRTPARGAVPPAPGARAAGARRRAARQLQGRGREGGNDGRAVRSQADRQGRADDRRRPAGSRDDTIGHPAQLGGVLVIAPDGRVTWSHIAHDASDNASPEEIIEAVRAQRLHIRCRPSWRTVRGDRDRDRPPARRAGHAGDGADRARGDEDGARGGRRARRRRAPGSRSSVGETVEEGQLLAVLERRRRRRATAPSAEAPPTDLDELARGPRGRPRAPRDRARRRASGGGRQGATSVGAALPARTSPISSTRARSSSTGR